VLVNLEPPFSVIALNRGSRLNTAMDPVNPIVRRWRADAEADHEAFWARAAAELPWLSRWDRVFVHEPPTFRWFLGAETNLAWQCVDHHAERGRGGQAAIVYANERGERRVLTYAQLRFEVERTAAALRGLGIGRGDRLTIYMPVCPEALVLMLATVRIGAIHSVVFAGFGAGALADRIEASGSRAVFCADVTYRKGSDVPLKGIVDAALELGGSAVEHVVLIATEAGDRQTTALLDDRIVVWGIRRGHDHFLDQRRPSHPANNPGQHRPAGQIQEHFPGQTSAAHSGLDDRHDLRFSVEHANTLRPEDDSGSEAVSYVDLANPSKPTFSVRPVRCRATPCQPAHPGLP